MPGSLGKWLFPGQWGVLSRCKLQAEFHGTRAICTRTRRCRFICCTGCSVKAVESLHFCVMPPQKMPGIRTVKDLLGNQRFGSRPATRSESIECVRERLIIFYMTSLHSKASPKTHRSHRPRGAGESPRPTSLPSGPAGSSQRHTQ